MSTNKKISPEEFVRLWQKADDQYQLAALLGRDVKWLRQKANRYRKHGVPLKKLIATNTGGRPPMDWDALKRIAQEETL